jgi:hypothetical protein
MSKNVNSYPIFANWKPTLRTWRALLSNALKSLSLTKNFGGTLVTNVTVGAKSEVAVKHGLGRVPTYVMLAKKRGGMIENGDTADSTEYVYLKNKASTTDGVVDVLIIP